MSLIGDRIFQLKNALPNGVTLIAVSKYHPNEDILSAYQAGQRIFGENIVQELCQKALALPQDIEWHFIGHLQKNKVKYIAPFISMIHSVDSFDLLKEINKYAQKNQRTISCLLQIHIAQEEAKFGFLPQKCIEMLQSDNWRELSNVSICGIMGIATNTENKLQIQNEFKALSDLFCKIKSKHFNNSEDFNCCSWGMSNDYQIAIKEGSNMVRIGTLIFGERIYNK